MLNMSDLEAAAAEGIISHDQAKRLRDFASRQSAAAEDALMFSQDTRDEPFRLLRGFRDFFIAIGIAIFAVGLTSLAISHTNWIGLLEDLTVLDLIWRIATACGLTLAGVVMAEWITRRQRLPLSSLVISIAFAAWSAHLLVTLCALVWAVVASGANLDDEVLPWLYFLGAVIGTIGFYWRYRLPFALFVLAGSAVGFAYFVLRLVLEDQWSDPYTRVLIGVLGVFVFAAAMVFDAKDPLRVTRFAECGFWLHLLAAPMLVHSLLLGQSDAAPDLVVILGTMGVMALIALLIDRRALLVAGLSYLGVAIAQIVSQSELLGGLEFAMTASVLGAAVLFLGLGWIPIRRGLMNLLPLGALKSKLPPVTTA